VSKKYRNHPPQVINQPPKPPSQQQVARLQQWAGPLPHPEALERFDALVPGAANRIITMAENDAKHLQNMEVAHSNLQHSERRLGQVFAFFIAIAALSASAFLGYTGHEVTASIVGGTTVLGLVTAFIVGRSSKPSTEQ
jgi:uncharacterized membrane protein